MVLKIPGAAAVIRCIHDNKETRFVRADMTITLCSRFVLYLSQSLPSWRRVHPLFTHSCQQLRRVASIWPNWQAILQSDYPGSFSPIIRSLWNADKCIYIYIYIYCARTHMWSGKVSRYFQFQWWLFYRSVIYHLLYNFLSLNMLDGQL